MDTARHEHWLHASLEKELDAQPVDPFRLTAEFNGQVLGLQPSKFPKRLHPERKAWTMRALDEELKEYRDASTIDEEVDALVDLIYFAAGRLYEMGVDGGKHFDLVHRANMKKQRGELAKRPGSQGYDAVKPEGWQAPDHMPLIRSRFPKIILLGHARHGKDTVAEILRDRYGFAFDSSSMFCAERVMMPFFNSRLKPGEQMYDVTEDRTYRGYHSVEECYADRVNFRDVWFREIEAYNTPDRSRLCREMFEAGNDIYVGMRSKLEFEAAQDLADIVLWVDASGRGVPPESEASCTVTADMADGIILNNGTLEDLVQAVDTFVNLIEVHPNVQ